MLAMKFKETTKLKSYGKTNALRKRSYDEEGSLAQPKVGYKDDYVNEIFAGLSWLG